MVGGRNMMHQRAGILALTCILALCRPVCGNTEIVNFASVVSPTVDVESLFPNMTWHTLDTSSETRQLGLLLAPYKQPWSDVCTQANCQHELFVKFDLDDGRDSVGWIPYNQHRYSLRISWPASIPAEFDMCTYTPGELYALLRDRQPLDTHVSSSPSADTRVTYARIRARYAGVRVPSDRVWHLFPPLIPPPSDPPTVNFHLVLDPLLFGFVPRSVVPTIWLVVAAVVVGMRAARPLTKYMEGIAAKINIESMILNGEKEE